MSDDLALQLGATRIGSTTAILPKSGRTASVATYLRSEEASPIPVPRGSSCWAPNKPSIVVDGRATWAEFAILHALQRHGWEGCWVKNWGRGREFCVDVGVDTLLPAEIDLAFQSIHAAVPQLKGAGTWDVLAWRDVDVRFIESKKHRSGDRLRPTQLAWMEAALELGIAEAKFAIVEYEIASSGIGVNKRTVPSRSIDSSMIELLSAVQQADPTTRVVHRDAVVSFGSQAVGPMMAWLDDDRLRRFAIAVLEKLVSTQPGALRGLRRYGSTDNPDSHLARVAAERARPPSERRGRDSMPVVEEHISDGNPPPSQGPCSVPNRNGSACSNPGRWPVREGWSCTTHYKSLVGRGQA